ncbi:MAG: DNA phosphorothioation-associated protein 4 [Potamolinea sp.]
MGGNRIRVAKDKAELVKALTLSEGTSGFFRHYTDVIVLAASLGAKRKKRTPLGEISKREPGPIEEEYFITKGYDLVIKLLTLAETKDAKILSSHEKEYEEKRIHIFEEYANGGLEILRDELRGAVDYSERILLLLSWEREKRTQSEEDFDLSRFLS